MHTSNACDWARNRNGLKCKVLLLHELDWDGRLELD